MSAPATTRSRDPRFIVRARADDRCEVCGALGTDWSHRIAASRGGLLIPFNGLWLDRACHNWAHANPDLARAAGIHLPTGADPELEPVWLRPALAWPGWWFLTDWGGYELLRKERPAPVVPACA